MKIKVLHLITELSSGGAQSALLRLLAGLDRSTFEPVVACLYHGDAAVAQQIRALGITVVDLGMTHKGRLDALGRLYQLLRREQPTILHTWLFHANLSGRILGRLTGVPIIICSERTMAMESEWRYHLNRWTIGYVDRVIAVSENVRQFCINHIGIPAEKLLVIYNGVDVASHAPLTREEARQQIGLDEDSFLLAVMSRLDPVKGVDMLIEAMLQVETGTLVIFGDGSEKAALQKKAQAEGLELRVRWMGYRADATSLLPAFDLFVQPSLHEGMPNAVLEAMAVGLPVVATAVGGTPEVVQDAVTGCLVPAGDPTGLAQAIRRLQNEPVLRCKMGNAGRERVASHFALHNMIAQTTALYEELLTTSRRSSE